jgi:hypothetical protein
MAFALARFEKRLVPHFLQKPRCTPRDEENQPTGPVISTESSDTSTRA